jgi:hypothetical protein
MHRRGRTDAGGGTGDQCDLAFKSEEAHGGQASGRRFPPSRSAT